VTGRYTYDRAGRLIETANTRSNGTLSRFTYALDAAGNRTAMTTRQNTVTYRYDELGRVTEACWSSTSCPGGAPASPLACIACVGALLTRPAATVNPPAGETYRTYTYDPVGNRLTEGANAGITTYAYNAADQLTTVTAPGSIVTTYTFDNNGNQTAAGSRSFTYDLANRLKTATVGTTTETFSYAGDGTRLTASTGSQANKTTKSLWDRNFDVPQLALERNGNDALLRSYRYGVGRISQIAGSTTYFYHPDGLGSVADVTSSAGASLTWSEYYPFGAIRQAGAASKPPAVDPFRFTGEQLDPITGLYYLRARQYDPGTGRFLSADPAGARVGDPFVSAYAYVNNRPTRATDPSGKICVEAIPAGALIGSVEPGGGTLAGAGAGTVVAAGCAVIVVGAVVLTAVAAWITGSTVANQIDTAKPPPPVYEPKVDPEIQKAILELIASLTPDVHTGLPGGGFPAWCKAHPATCKGAVLAIGTIVTWMIATFGGIEPLEDAANNGPEERDNGK
jgi:RHS repeat-associated protein